MMCRIFIWSCCAAVLLAAGCQNTVNTVENEEKTMTPNTVRDARFVTDGFLRDRLALKSVNVAETADGFMRVQVEAVNVRTGAFAQAWSGITGDNPYKVMYKFDWFDENGMQVKGILSNWRNATIIPGETAYFQGIAPTASCKDFKLSLREAN